MQLKNFSCFEWADLCEANTTSDTFNSCLTFAHEASVTLCWVCLRCRYRRSGNVTMESYIEIYRRHRTREFIFWECARVRSTHVHDAPMSSTVIYCIVYRTWIHIQWMHWPQNNNNKFIAHENENENVVRGMSRTSTAIKQEGKILLPCVADANLRQRIVIYSQRNVNEMKWKKFRMKSAPGADTMKIMIDCMCRAFPSKTSPAISCSLLGSLKRYVSAFSFFRQQLW